MTKTNTLNVFLSKTTTSLTLLDETFSDGPNEVNATNKNLTPVTTVTIPYIKGTSETIRVAHKPTTTLWQLLTNV